MARPKDSDKINIVLTFDEVIKTMTHMENELDVYLKAMRDYPETSDQYMERANEIGVIIDKLAAAAGIPRVKRAD
jgi:hypothetical protein